MTGTVRTLLLLGLLVLGLVFVMLWRDGRPVNQAESAVSGGVPRIGRSTVGHGGTDFGRPSNDSGRSGKPLRPLPFKDSAEASKR